MILYIAAYIKEWYNIYKLGEGVIIVDSEKKSYYSEAQNRATQKYIKNNLEEIKFRVPKGEKGRYKEAAEKSGLSMAKFFTTAANEKINRDNL